MTTTTTTEKIHANAPAISADRRHRYACANCGAAGDRQWIAAMDAAGFGLRHLCCDECGQQALIDRRNPDRY